MQTKINKAKGLQFEKILVVRAAASNMWAQKNELSFRFLKGGAIRPIRADLDFKVIRKDGRIAMVDCKAFEGDTFGFSAIEKHQLHRACTYHQWGVPAGFVVLHAQKKLVVFYPGWLLASLGRGSSVSPSHGRALGAPLTFSTAGLFGPTP